MAWLLSRYIRHTYGEKVHAFIYGWTTIGLILFLSYGLVATAVHERRQQYIREHWSPNPEALERLGIDYESD